MSNIQFPDILIRASAGSGKTFRLSNRYLGLVHQGVSPDQILATTFTRKAAGEILDRVMVRVAEAALDDTERQELAEHLGNPSLSKHDCLRLLHVLILHLHRLRVCTLDAFFAQLAGTFSLELGLPPGWRIVELVEDQRLRREAIGMTLEGDAKREVDRLLQLMAKGEARRSISALVQSTVDDLYDLYMETEESAWQKIPKPRMLTEQQIDAAVDALLDAPLPDDSRAAAAREKDATAARQRDWANFVGRGMAKKVMEGDSTYRRKEMPPELVTAYEQLLTQARAVLLHQVANQTEATYQLLDKFHHAYEQLKHNSRAVRFDDITRALARSDTLRNIRHQQFRLDTTIDHLLLDEFQDTSLAQWHVLRPFARKVTAHESPSSTAVQKSSFFCVGDVKQAIYGWRGGLSEIFDALQDELTGLAEEPMDASYRSSQPVIDTVNQAFTHMIRHPNLGKLEEGVTQWCHRFQRHTTKRTGLRGYVELRTAPAAEEEKSSKEAKIGFAARRIGQLVAETPGCSIGVLVRSNDSVAHMIYELRHRGIPASEEGGNPLTDSPAVQVLLSLLKLADHPGDTVARFHVSRSPLGAPLQLTSLNDDARAWSLAQEIRSQLLQDGYGSTILHWARLLESSCDRRDHARLQQFVATAFAYQRIATLRTADFLAFVESERVADPTTAAVRVMTIHQAKGLQFDIVVLPDLDCALSGQPDSCVVGQPAPTEPVDRICLYRNTKIQKLLPPELQELFDTAARRNANEAMCVLYVAMTRAVHALHMIIEPSSATEQSLHKTPAGLLRAGLTDSQTLSPNEIVYQHGDPNWFQHEPTRDTPPSVPVRDRPCSPIVLAPSARDTRLEHTAPSELEGGRRVSGHRVLDLRTSTATSRGTLIHALFEQVTWLDDGPPSRAQLQQAAERLRCTGVDIAAQLDAFAEMTARPQIAALLHREFYHQPTDPQLLAVLGANRAAGPLSATVQNERRFAVRDAGQLLTGAIDRLVQIRSGDQLVAAEILDYKTDHVDADDPHAIEQLVDHYRPQIEAYRRAVSTITGLSQDRIVARLLFVGVGKAVAV